MKRLFQFSVTLYLLLSCGLLLGQNNTPIQSNKIELEDIDKLIGEWNGTLTYLDYSSKKPYSMPCDLTVREKRNNRKLKLKYVYPKEPKANSRGKIKISKDRTVLNKKRIKSRRIDSNGNVEILVEYLGKDGNESKKALIRNIYLIGNETLIIRKEIKFEDSEEWIMRNEFNFKKK